LVEIIETNVDLKKFEKFEKAFEKDGYGLLNFGSQHLL